MLAPASQREALAALREQLHAPPDGERPVFFRGLAGLVPGGLRRGSLIECLSDGGCGAAALSLAIAREACLDGGALVVVDRSGRFYPPAAASLGIDCRTILVRPSTRKDELWTLHQALRCRGVGSVVGWPSKLDARAFRAMQLAAESSGAVGLFIQPIGVRGHPSWSEVQLLIEAQPSAKRRRMKVEVLRRRTGNVGASIVVELDDATGVMRVVTELAAATDTACSTRA